LGVLTLCWNSAANLLLCRTTLVIRLTGFILLFHLFPHSGVKGQPPSNELKFDLSNPGLFAGSTFGEYFQRLYINGDFNQMLAFTSSRTRKEFGDKHLLAYYRQVDFGYSLKLKSKTIDNGIIYLNYLTTINATSRVVRMPVVVERDTVRIYLNEIRHRIFLVE